MSKRTSITIPLVADLNAYRAKGWSIERIGRKFGVSPTTVRRHTSPAEKKRMQGYEKARWDRLKADPAKYEAEIKRRVEHARAARAAKKEAKLESDRKHQENGGSPQLGPPDQGSVPVRHEPQEGS